jgi:uncharacterized membrane protein
MEKLWLTLHIVAAIFVIGPLAATGQQAPRALKNSDAARLRTLATLVTIYGWASLLVVALGLPLVQEKYHNSFSDAWVIISLILTLVASGLVIALLAPLLQRATKTAAAGGSTANLIRQAAPLGGLVGVCYITVTVLMVYQPGG